ncbi:hypothetical protein GCM10022226_43660 [Sphaerisporangium flaviroseum]|uniref:Uncharacterized protein n=1 Tax=Sphaerisporangium flaviroseum TaxID=509199 RepID=A0ABP7IH81_9ACTN
MNFELSAVMVYLAIAFHCKGIESKIGYLNREKEQGARLQIDADGFAGSRQRPTSDVPEVRHVDPCSVGAQQLDPCLVGD